MTSRAYCVKQKGVIDGKILKMEKGVPKQQVTGQLKRKKYFFFCSMLLG